MMNHRLNYTNDRPARYRIGYWLADKKYKKLKFEDFEDLCRSSNIDIIKIDLTLSMESQGPFDLIFHKLTDQITRSEQGCLDASFQIARFKEYIMKNPQIIVIDPIEKVMQLFDRSTQYSIIHQVVTSSRCFTPDFVQLNSKDSNQNTSLMKNIQFPIVCKPIVSHGSSECHEMAIVYKYEGLQDVDYPCVVQHFVNHDARLFKVFLIGESQFVVHRPSIRNMYPGDYATVFFNSNDVSKPDATSHLNLEFDTNLTTEYVDNEEIENLCLSLQRQFQLQLLGIDIIKDNETGRLAVIDVNTFPGYEDVPDFFKKLLDYLIGQLNKRNMNKFA